VAREALWTDENRDGNLNYLVSRIIDETYDTRYKDLNAAIGVLECIKLELYRRVVAPYEDTKLKQNGEVYFSR
jgi:hypothetical protein